MMISQDRVNVDLYIRQDDDNRWLLVSSGSLDETVSIEPIHCQIRVAEFYRNVELAVTEFP